MEERKTARWEHSNGEWIPHCSLCGAYYDILQGPPMKFCPNCGATMGNPEGNGG